MGTADEFKAGLARRYQDDPDFRAAVDAAETEQEVLRVAAAAGLRIEGADAGQEADGGLSDSELDSVSGGTLGAFTYGAECLLTAFCGNS